MKDTLQDYQQTLIARHYNNNFSDETKSEISKIIIGNIQLVDFVRQLGMIHMYQNNEDGTREYKGSYELKKPVEIN